jgi:flagellar motor switch protein FliG
MLMATNGLNEMDKAAVLLSVLGEDLASDLMRFLSPVDIKLLGRRMRLINNINSKIFFEVIDEFKEHLAIVCGPGDADDYVKNTIVKALGPEKAGGIIKSILDDSAKGGLDTLKWMDPKALAEFVKNEHPQTIAVILASLSPEQAAQVLSLLDQESRSDVMIRVATMGSLAPGAMEELEKAINQNLSVTIGLQTHSLGGTKVAAQILNHVDRTTESEILSGIEGQDSDLSDEIQEQMFLFADIVKINRVGIQTILKCISGDQLVLALKTADEDLKNLILTSMSDRTREKLVDEMESVGPVKLSEVNQAQLEIARITWRLIQNGDLSVKVGEANDQFI